MLDSNKYFIANGSYVLKGIYDSIFICLPCSQYVIGKLVRYVKNNNMYEKTATTYFLNDYHEGDIKEYMLNRANYEMIGMLDKNYHLSDDSEYVYKE